MTFRTVGQALRWYAKATAQADGLKAIWPDPKTIPQPPGQGRDQEALFLAIWGVWQALAAVCGTCANRQPDCHCRAHDGQLPTCDQCDVRLLLEVRVYGLAVASLIPAGAGRRHDRERVAEWRVDRAEGIVAERLRAEGILEERAT